MISAAVSSVSSSSGSSDEISRLVENARQSLRRSASEDRQGVCKNIPMTSARVAKCKEMHVRYNGTPFRSGLKNVEHGVKVRMGEPALKEFKAAVAAMISQETSLNTALARQIIENPQSQLVDPASSSNRFSLAVSKPLLTAKAPAQPIPLPTPGPLLPMPRPLLPLPMPRPQGGGITLGPSAPPSQQMDIPPQGGMSDQLVPGLQAPKTVDGKSYCAITQSGLMLFNTLYPQEIRGLGPEMQQEIAGKKVTARQFIPIAMETTPSISVADYIAQESQKGNGIILMQTAMVATKSIDVAAALAPVPCGENVVLLEPSGGWRNEGNDNTLYAFIVMGGVLAIAFGAYLFNE